MAGNSRRPRKSAAPKRAHLNRAVKEIQELQNSTELLIPRAPFSQYVCMRKVWAYTGQLSDLR